MSDIVDILSGNGQNSAKTDALHAYKEGINAQVDAAMMDYGNPILLERLQATPPIRWNTPRAG